MPIQVGQEYTLSKPISTGVAPGQTQYQAPAGSKLKVQNTKVVNGQTYYDINQTAYGGGTGWVAANELEGATGANMPTNSPVNTPTNASASAINANSVAPKPTINLQGVYDTAIKDSNVSRYQSTVDAVQEKINQKRRELATAEANYNDNPYYSEATRTKRISTLRAAAQNDINNLLNEQATAQNQVAQAKADAQVRVNLASQQYNIDDANYQRQVQTFNTLLTNGALNTATPDDLAQIATSTGLSYSMIQSIINTSKAKEAKPQLVTVDDGTHQKLVAVDAYGNKLSETILGASKTTTTGSSKTGVGGTDFTTSQYNQAVSVIKEADVMNQRNDSNRADKKLAAWEVSSAISRVAAYLGGDTQKAADLVALAMNSEGYTTWSQ